MSDEAQVKFQVVSQDAWHCYQMPKKVFVGSLNYWGTARGWLFSGVEDRGISADVLRVIAEFMDGLPPQPEKTEE